MSGPDAAPTLRILVADDDASLRTVIAETLRGEGYIVDEAENGVAALERLRENVPDLMLVDIVMPELDGNELIRRCRSIPGCAAVPVVVISGTHGLPNDASELGVRAVLVKPFDLGVLVAMIGRLVRRTEAGD